MTLGNPTFGSTPMLRVATLWDVRGMAIPNLAGALTMAPNAALPSERSERSTVPTRPS